MLRRTWVGVLLGLAAAIIYSAWVAVVRMLAGPAPLQRLGVTLPTIIAVYFIAFPVCGIVAMLLKPLLWRSAVGAVVLGGVAAIPLYAGFALTFPRTLPLKELLTIGVAIAMVVGGIVGFNTWNDESPNDVP